MSKKIEVTIKKTSSDEPNVSKRHVSYDVYHNGKYHTTFKDVNDALDHKEKMHKEDVDLDETVLSIQQRQKRAQIMRRNKTKIARAREISKKKMAPEANIRKRAFVQARQLIRRRVAGERGAEYEKLGPSEKIAIDRAVEGKQKAIKKLALRLIPRVKQAEAKRLHAFIKGQQLQNQGQPEGKSKESSGSSSVNESLNNLFTEAFTSSDPSTDAPIATSQKKMPAKGKSKSDVIVQYNKFQEEVDYDTSAFAALFKKAEKSGIDLEILGEVYNRGWNAWSKELRVTQEQYAFARVNSFINQGKTCFNEDADLHEARAPGRAYVAPFNDEKGNQKGWKSSNKWGKVKYWQPHAKKSALKHAGLQEEEVSHTNENFIDGKGPGRPGDSARHGLKGKSASELRKIRSSDTASPRKKQLAHFMLNMTKNEEAELDEAGSKYNIPMARVKPKKVPTRTFSSVLDEVDVPAKHLDRARSVWHRTKDVEAVKKFVSSVKEEAELDEKRGLWDNIHAKRKRIKAGSGERMRKPGSEGSPSKQNFRDASESIEEGYDVNDKHYKALTDLDLNTKNRDMTTKNDGYGPLNPMDKKGSKAFWDEKAKMWNTTTEAAMEARCGNCAAFNQAPAIMKKMAEGLGPAGDKIQDLSNLGFCELFEFKCAGSRTCNKWLVNGPITEEDNGTNARKKIEKVDRARPHGELAKQTEIIRKVVEDHPNCNTSDCCGQCDTAVNEKLGNSQKDPKKREVGTDSLVKAYKADTPYANESINESFNIAFASGVGVTLTAADLGIRVQGGFALHPSVIEQMDEMEEEVRSADTKGVIVKTASGKTVVRRQKVNHKIIGTGNLTDGKPDDTV